MVERQKLPVTPHHTADPIARDASTGDECTHSRTKVARVQTHQARELLRTSSMIS